MSINQFLFDLKNVVSNYEEDAKCELLFERTNHIAFDTYDQQVCEETEHFTGVEYIIQTSVFEDYFEGTIIREIKDSDYCMVIKYAT